MNKIKQIPEFPRYLCTEDGVIFSNAKKWKSGKPKKLLPRFDKDGYIKFTILKGKDPFTRSAHSLVAATFIGPRPPGFVVNHKDGNKTNNHYSNLEYVTPADNERHARKVLNKKLLGEKASQSKLVTDEVLLIRKLYSLCMSKNEIASFMCISNSQVIRILNGRNWGHV